MSLLREIQDEIARSHSDITSLLLKCKILASRLGSAELADWVKWELSGYAADQPVPEYRLLSEDWAGQWVFGAFDAGDFHHLGAGEWSAVGECAKVSRTFATPSTTKLYARRGFKISSRAGKTPGKRPPL
jgi:hypothetical protein